MNNLSDLNASVEQISLLDISPSVITLSLINDHANGCYIANVKAVSENTLVGIIDSSSLVAQCLLLGHPVTAELNNNQRYDCGICSVKIIGKINNIKDEFVKSVAVSLSSDYFLSVDNLLAFSLDLQHCPKLYDEKRKNNFLCT